MTEKNTVYKLFLSLNIPDFSLFFYVKIATPLTKQPPLKIEILSSSPLPFEKFCWRFNPPPPQCTICIKLNRLGQ